MVSDNSSSDRRFMVFGLRIVGEFGGLIAIPVVVFVLLGRWLDGRWGTKPWMTIAGFVVAALVSGLMVWRRTKDVASEYQRLIDEKGIPSKKNSE
ncbi:MAG: AtpZ/AtpI family protein [bacterium]|nr:AtpZ/AtpI family protein [bacterium]